MATEQDNTAPPLPQPDAASMPAPANNPDYVPTSTPITKGVPGGAASNQNPIHTNVTRDPASTPGYFRVLLAALPARYLLRGVLSGFKDTSAHNMGLGKLPDWPKTTIDNLIQPISAAIELEKGKTASPEAIKKAKQVLSSIGAKNADGKFAEGQNHYRIWQESLEGLDPKGTDQLSRQQRTLSELAKDRYEENFIGDIRRKARNRIIETKYDAGLGIGSTLVTTVYGWRVYTDIKNMFAEAVAYENGKPAADIGFGDLRRSDNVLVKESLKNLGLKSIFRYVGDGLFFTRFIAKLNPKMNALNSFGFGDIAVGLKGGQLIYDITNKKTTFFEDLLQLIDKKLNPIRGIGDPLSVSEVIDLYQKYAITHQPKLMFTDATIQQNKDGINWEKSNKIFSHITDLMNATYKYKHTDVNDDAETPPADFALPKFLYLLGHNMINPYKPEETLAYVDIANRYGIEAVKQVHTAISHGAHLEEMLQKYPVDLSKLKEIKATHAPAAMPVFFPANKDSMPEPANKPDTKIAVVAAEREAMAPASTPSITQG